ncbi:hypothetical protein Daus18300_000402 [Diaporthe australafricana]|uniref:Cyanovirin-N domain-containing protein n=1 Tax=Diaporthe australafricana TaxID=127596 RepID=A0ABR3Y4Z1_9PEZI
MKIALTTTLLLQAAGLVAAGVAAPSSDELSEGSTLTTTESTNEESTIERRAYGHGTGRVICGRFANADGPMAKDLIRSLENKDKDKTWDVGPGACNRVTCWDTSAIYVCNDNKFKITVRGEEVAQSLGYIRKNCCNKNDKSFLAGQQFTPWGWNSAVAYGNCRDPPQIRPHNAGGFGVNAGNCFASDRTVGF